MHESRFEKMGFWWLPDNPALRVPGTLVYGHDVSSELRLLGSLRGADDVVDMIARAHEEFRPEVILGTASDGTDYTLVNSLSLGGRVRFSPVANVVESFLPTIVIEGRHFASQGEIVFRQMTVRLSHLSQWFQLSCRSLSREFSDDELSKIVLEWRPSEGITAAFGRGHIEIGHDWNLVPGRPGQDSVLSEEASVSVVPERPIHMDQFLEECLSPITTFVTVGVGYPLSVRQLRAKAAADCEGKSVEEQRRVSSVQLYWKKRRYRSDDKELFPHDMVFTYPEIGDRLAECLTNWVHAYQQIKPVMQLFFDRVITSEAISPNTFLNAVQAAEAYHRYCRDGSEIPKDEHKLRLSAILDTSPPEYREWLKEKLCFSNEESLAQRLTELLEERKDLFALTSEEIRDLTRRIRDLRNFFTHYTKKKNRSFGTGGEFYVLGTLMQWVLIACFLEEMGLSRERAHELVSKDQAFTYFRAFHLKAEHVPFFKVESVRPAEEATSGEPGPGTGEQES